MVVVVGRSARVGLGGVHRSLGHSNGNGSISRVRSIPIYGDGGGWWILGGSVKLRTIRFRKFGFSAKASNNRTNDF